MVPPRIRTVRTSLVDPPLMALTPENVRSVTMAPVGSRDDEVAVSVPTKISSASPTSWSKSFGRNESARASPAWLMRSATTTRHAARAERTMTFFHSNPACAVSR